MSFGNQDLAFPYKMPHFWISHS